MKRIHTNSLILFLVFLITSIGVSASGDTVCSSCEPAQTRSCCTDNAMGHQSTEQTAQNKTNGCSSGDEGCLHDCDFDPAIVVSLSQQQVEKKYSLVPLQQFTSSTTKLNHLTLPSGIPPPVTLTTPLYTLHCVFLI